MQEGTRPCMRLSRFLFAVGVFLTLGLTSGDAAQAQIFNWFNLIHCAGDDVDHTDGAPPERESYTNQVNV